MASKASAKGTANDLTLTVEGTRLEVGVTIRKLASSKAGGTGFSFKTLCKTHKKPVNKPTVCQDCDGEPAAILKGYPLGDKFLTLTEEQVKALKPQGDNSVRILQVLSAQQAGSFGLTENLLRLLPGAYVLTPSDDSTATMKRFAALHALLAAGRIGVAQVTHRGSFNYSLVVPTPSGALLVQEIYLPRDTAEIPTVALPTLRGDEAIAFEQRGAALAAKGMLDLKALDADPYREAREKAIMAAVEAGAESVTVEVPAKPKADDSILGLV